MPPTHPPMATGFAAAGVPLSPALLSEIVLTLGCVPLTDYATPTTGELAGTLDGVGGTVTINVATNDAVDQLGPGLHVATITFRNEKTGREHQRKYSIETEQPITLRLVTSDPEPFSTVWGESPGAIASRSFIPGGQ